MSQTRDRMPFPIGRVILWALAGGVLALVLGLVGVSLAPDNGFADLALASMTKIFFVPLGAAIGGVAGWRTAKPR